MAGYVIRSLAELAAEAKGAFVQAVQGTAAKLFPNVWRVESKVLALLNFEHEQRRSWLYDQIFASRAAAAWLARHGFELGLTRTPASSATGTLLCAATHNLVVPAGMRFLAGGGIAYTALAGGTAAGNVIALPVAADVPGAAGNLGAGFPLSLALDQDAPVGLGPGATVDEAGLAGGADAETLEGFRARILARKRNPPQGGSAFDYATWAAEALGPGTLRRAYVDSFANDNRSVWLCFTVNDGIDGIPSQAQVDLVQAYCDDPIRRPVTARVFACAPIRLPVEVVLTIRPDTEAVRASVEEEITATFADRAEVGTATPAVFSRSWLIEGIARAVGEDAHELSAPARSVIATAGYLAVLESVRFAEPDDV